MRATLSAALLAALVTTASSSHAAPSASRCSTPHASRTLARNRLYRAYADNTFLIAYLCDRRTGGRWELGDVYRSTSGRASVKPVALNGTAVAWQQTTVAYTAGEDHVQSKISVRDFGRPRSREQRHTLRAGGTASELVVSGRLSIAWVERRPHQTLLRRIVNHRQTVLDAGHGEHAPRDLHLRAHRVHWRRGDQRFSARLP
jgi:hypothetical protein